MATLSELYTRLILDTNRDDMGAGGELEQAKVDAVAAAVERHAGEQFWFNRASGTGTTTAGDATLTMPAGIRFAALVAYDGEALARVPLAAIEHRSESGPPAKWAENEGTVQLWPVPDGAYVLTVFGLAAAGVPAAGGDSNHWTIEAYELVLNEAKMILCRGPLRDPDGLALARDGRDEALARLRRETRRRGGAMLRTDPGLRRGAAAAGYDIAADR